ncbi:TolC family protein [Pedobacter jejuensis]|nr:TolC family protein [Pedobacter jejuensis]
MYNINMRAKHKLNACTWIFFIFFTWILNPLFAQQTQSVSGSAPIFTLNDMEEIVLQNHPIVKQAALLSKEAGAKVLQSLGKFDPAINASFGRKIFGGTEYYNHWDSELKVPLWLAGADLNVGYDRNVGVYNNPETRTSTTGLSGVGLTIPLGQGLIIDSRRNTLRQAKIMVDYAEADKINQINKVWFGAVKDYWSWYYAHQQYNLINEGVDLASRRFSAIRQQVILGDKPPIDSVEASITLEDRKVQLQDANVKLANSRLILSNHLWNSQGVPTELPANALPQETNDTENVLNQLVLDSLVQQATESHPEILKIRYQKSKLDVERLYRQEMLKPKLNIKGSFLAGRRDFSYVPDYYDFRLANYKVGIDFAFPLFLREERGKLREVKIQQAEVEYGLQQTGREIQNGVLSAVNEVKALKAQFVLQTKNLASQRTLVKGELQKFELGESNLFLINSRETKLIDMRIKQAEIISYYQKALAELYFKAGKRFTLNDTKN